MSNHIKIHFVGQATIELRNVPEDLTYRLVTAIEEATKSKSFWSNPLVTVTNDSHKIIFNVHNFTYMAIDPEPTNEHSNDQC